MPIVFGSKKVGSCKFCGGIVVKGYFSQRGFRSKTEWYVCVLCYKRRRRLDEISKMKPRIKATCEHCGGELVETPLGCWGCAKCKRLYWAAEEKNVE